MGLLTIFLTAITEGLAKVTKGKKGYLGAQCEDTVCYGREGVVARMWKGLSRTRES